jgi:radical SAM protein with 4Fe4S-binding SPASM domain
MPPYYKSFNNYRGAWSNAAEIDPAVPLNIDIELAAVCNLSCPACFITSPEYTRNKHQAYMTIEMVERILSECAAVGVPAIKLNWRGESTLHPEFKTILDSLSVGKIDYSQRQYCCYPSQRIVVSVNGDMFPCCVDYKETMPLGNVRSITIMDAWRGRAVERLRKNLRVNTFQYGAQCFECTSFMAYKAKEREYVQDREIGVGVPAPGNN